MRNDCLQSRYLRIGSLQCEVTSNPPRYAEMLADAYGASLISREQYEESCRSIELTLHIKETPCPVANLSDTLTVTPTKDGHQIETDPISCLLVHQYEALENPKAYADITIRQPTMDPTPLGYHLWLITNRILLLLDSLLVHAAAIELNGKVNLFCGHKGAGKSTLSVFLAQAGGNILAEDHVILRRKHESFRVSGCTSRMRVTSTTEQFLLPDRLNHKAIPVGDIHKKEFAAERFFSAIPHVERKPHRLFLNQVGKSFCVRQISAKEALLQMVDRTGNMYRFADQKDYTSFFGFLAAFINQIEIYSLELSPDLTKLPLVLEMLSNLDGELNQGEDS